MGWHHCIIASLFVIVCNSCSWQFGQGEGDELSRFGLQRLQCPAGGGSGGAACKQDSGLFVCSFMFVWIF